MVSTVDAAADKVDGVASVRIFGVELFSVGKGEYRWGCWQRTLLRISGLISSGFSGFSGLSSGLSGVSSLGGVTWLAIWFFRRTISESLLEIWVKPKMLVPSR